MNRLVLWLFVLLVSSSCSKDRTVDKKFNIGQFQNLKEINFYCYSPIESKYISFSVIEPEKIKSMMNGFSLEEAEECMCKKSAFATFIKNDGSQTKIEFGPHSFSSADHEGLYKTSESFWDLFWDRINPYKSKD